MAAHGKVKVTLNGPYLVSGGLPLREQTIVADMRGQSLDWKITREFETQASYALCRCGYSANKPFCDGSHARVGFDGTETAGQRLYEEEATLQRGPGMSLSDDEHLCAFGRFCDPNGQVWAQVDQTDDPARAKAFVAQVNKCYAGRLVAWDNESGQPVELPRPRQLSITQDPVQRCSGPIWVEGRVEIEAADGRSYEIRNRVTLCRCGQSSNKPFCDGTHAAVKFNDKR